MELDLHIAAVKGDVPFLLKLLAKDELLLNKNMTGNQDETPLHIAAMLGHLDFVEEVLARKAELAKKQDSQGSTPLHLAAAKGYLNIVVSLLRAEPDVCDVCDDHERNPLHVAAMKGHVDVLEYLVQKRRKAASNYVEHGQTILHLCVMHNRPEVLRFLIDILPNGVINKQDEDGNTILHLAARYGETKTMLFLTNKGVKRNIKNSDGFTALDLLAQGESAERKRKWQNNMHKTIMVVATLLATMSFQISFTPPGGVLEGNSPSDGDTTKHIAGISRRAIEPSAAYGTEQSAGKSIMDPDVYEGFITCNTISFIASLSIIMIFLSGLPLKRHRITTWLTMLVTWVAIIFMAATYFISVFVVTPREQVPTFIFAVALAVEAWIGLMAFLFLCHFIRLILKLVRKVRNFVRGRWAESRSRSHAV